MELNPNQLIDEAILNAVYHHRGQVDKAGKPYILHPLRVMLAVAALPPASEQVTIEQEMMAAVLHDAVEDTEMTLEDVRGLFGDTVAELVDGLSKREGESYFGFLARVMADPAVFKIKIADIRDNLGRVNTLENPVTREMLRVKYMGALHRLGVE